jgi:hypothetical protein
VLHKRVLLGRPVVAGPGRFEERQTQKPFAVLGGQGKRRGAASRVPDEMETVEAAKVGLAENPLNLSIETKVRRWLVVGVDLEIFRDRIDPISERLQQRRVRRLCRYYPPGSRTTACRADTARELTPGDYPVSNDPGRGRRGTQAAHRA